MSEKEICKEIYISEVYLRKLYNIHFGMAPKMYIRKVKMKKAQTLLRITNNKISDIAYEIGYTNISKFSNQFRKEFGMLPSTYKKEVEI